MIVFAILGLLIGLLFLFVRQKIGAFEARLNLLTDTVQTMAGLNRFEQEEEEEEVDDIELESIQMITLDAPVKTIELEYEVKTIELEPEVKTITLEKRVVSDDNVDYESLSLKDLKDKVTESGGPKLRTKKELIDFLKNKI